MSAIYKIYLPLVMGTENDTSTSGQASIAFFFDLFH